MVARRSHHSSRSRLPPQYSQISIVKSCMRNPRWLVSMSKCRSSWIAKPVEESSRMAPGRGIIAAGRTIFQQQLHSARLNLVEGSASPLQSAHSQSCGFRSQYLRSWSSDVAVNEAVSSSTEPTSQSETPQSSKGTGISMIRTKVFTQSINLHGPHISQLKSLCTYGI